VRERLALDCRSPLNARWYSHSAFPPRSEIHPQVLSSPLPHQAVGILWGAGRKWKSARLDERSNNSIGKLGPSDRSITSTIQPRPGLQAQCFSPHPP
jgi:hypothetical protein